MNTDLNRSTIRRSIIGQNTRNSNVRGEGSKLKSDKLTFGRSKSNLSVVEVEEPQIVEKIVEVVVPKPKRKVVVEKEVIIEKKVPGKRIMGNEYYVSYEERNILQDTLMKVALLNMDNKRLHAEIEYLKNENTNLRGY